MGRSAAKQIARAAASSERSKLLRAMSPSLRSLAGQIMSDMTEQRQANVRFYHKLGRQFLDVIDNPAEYQTDDQKLNNVMPYDLLRKMFPASIDTINKSVQFARLYSDEDVKTALAKRNQEHAEFRLHWGHFVHLVSVDNKAVRVKFEDRAVSEILDPSELHKLIMQHFNGPRRPGAGRSLGIPKTLPKQLNQIVDMSRLYAKRAATVWHGKEHSVFGNVLAVPTEQYTKDTLKQLTEVEESLIAVQASAEEDLAACRRTIEHVKAALNPKETQPESKPAPAKPLRKIKEVVASAVKSGRPVAAK